MQNENVSISSQIIQILLKAFVFGILPFVIFIAVTSRTSILGGIRSFVVLTGSMEPAVPVGSIVFTKKFPAYQPSDIVAFKAGNVTVTHRIIDFGIKPHFANHYAEASRFKKASRGKESGEFIIYKTQGDANNNPDSQPVSDGQILGRAFYIVPYVGKLAIFLKTLPGFLLLIAFPALVFIIFEILNIKNELTKEIEKKIMQRQLHFRL